MARWISASSLMKGTRRLAISALALSVSAALSAAYADKATLKFIGNPLPPSAAAMANLKPIKLPQPSLAQMKASGMLAADGSLNRPAGNPIKSLVTSPKILSQGSFGGPVSSSVETVPQPKQLGATGSAASGVSSMMSSSAGTIAPMNYGDDYEWPFTTSRVELNGKLVNSKMYPYRASGLLIVSFADGTAGACSATLIARGVLITAAHCVAQLGAGFYNANWTFYPGFFNGKAPYGGAYAVAIGALSSYLDGTDSCTNGGISCLNDVAVIVLSNKKGKYIGAKTGWLGVGIDGWGFNNAGDTQITQLGYPVGIDYGIQMQRNDALAEIWDGTFSFNTLMGTQMNEGSSGGPWVTNFGVPGYPNGVFPGNNPSPDVITGVTSWGYANSPVLVAGSSPLTSGNIGYLLSLACSSFPAACAP